MSAMNGYKLTETGMIPEDWEVSTVGREFHVQLGKMLDAERNRGVPKPYVGNRAVRWGSFDTTEIGSVPLSPADLTRYRLEAGDILACEGGEVGRSAIWNDELPECYYQKALHRLRPKTDYNAQLLVALLYRASTIGGFANFVSQTSIAHLTKEKFQAFPIIKPPKAEQTAIAEALSDMDEAIAAQEAVIAKKRALKTATMQALLSGTRRLPGFSGEWESIQLGTIAHIKTGSRNNEDKRPDGKYPLFVRSQTVERIDSYSYEEEAILVPGEGGVGSIFHYINGKFDCHQRVYKISKFADYVSGRFVYFSMIHSFGAHAMQNTVKATVDSLRLPTFKGFTFLAPARAEQDAIAATLLDIETELAEQEEMLTKLRQLKVGIMQQLLTGKIRLV